MIKQPPHATITMVLIHVIASLGFPKLQKMNLLVETLMNALLPLTLRVKLSSLVHTNVMIKQLVPILLAHILVNVLLDIKVMEKHVMMLMSVTRKTVVVIRKGFNY